MAAACGCSCRPARCCLLVLAGCQACNAQLIIGMLAQAMRKLHLGARCTQVVKEAEKGERKTRGRPAGKAAKPQQTTAQPASKVR